LTRTFCLLALLALAACGGPAEPTWAPQARVDAARYIHDGPPTVTLFTVQSTRNGSGAHSGLMVNADERIIFDPAGTFKLPFLPERNDVHFGMDENAVKVYIDYHARETFDVVVQEREVTPAQAAMISRLVQEYGAVPKAQCSLAISRILGKVPGFETIRASYLPNATMTRFGEMPGTTTRRITDDDADQNHNVLFDASQRPKPPAYDY
jgi:hypothetical protein